MQPEWINDFEAFYKDVGPRPSPKHTLDRIDNNLGYLRGNIRWTDRFTQANNKRNNIVLTFNGKTQTMGQWAKELNIPREYIWWRYNSGKPIEQVLSVLNLKHPKKPLPANEMLDSSVIPT